jgi:hypothetical protein
LRAAGEKFTRLIHRREAEGCMKYTPTQLVSTFNIQTEKDKKSTEDMSIRYMRTKKIPTYPNHRQFKSTNPLLSLKTDAEMIETKDTRGGDNRKPKTLSFSGSHLNRQNYSRQNAKNKVDKKLLNIAQDPSQTQKYQTKIDLDTTVKTKKKPTDESKRKLKALNFPENGSIMVCFLCGKTNSHYAYDCRTYKGEVCTENQCKKCGLFHDVSKCKHHK